VVNEINTEGVFMKKPNEIYREKISSFWGKVATVLFFGASLLFVVLFFYQRTYGPIGDKPAPDWFFIMMFGIFLLIGLLVTNFNSLTISANTSGITVGYGRVRYRVLWEDISGCELDKGSQVRQYGGYGIRFGRRNGRSVLIYNTMGSPVVLIEAKSGKYGYFGFSTKHPDEVMELIESYKS
jgi:hypothetical protein